MEANYTTFTIHTSLAYESVKAEFVENLSIVVDPATGSIVDLHTRDEDVGATSTLRLGPQDIDLRGKTVLPGLVDAHTHIFLHSYKERPAQDQILNESIPERTIRATTHLRRALLSGFTTYRDLGTEGLHSLDTNIRDAVNRQLPPGPRLFVATEALASTGSYAFRTENAANGVSGPPLSDECDGPWGVRRAVRRRVAAGADVIKFYADYRRKIMRFPPVQAHPYIGGMPFPPSDPNPQVVMFTQEEMNAIVEEATMANLPVACHAGTEKGAIMAAKAGVTTIEHGSVGSEALIKAMQHHDTIYVPTLAATEAIRPEEVPQAQAWVRKVHENGVTLAAGGDTGVFNHGDGAREMELMIGAGIPVEKVLQAGTLGGWKACGGVACGYEFGHFKKGARADIIALESDPRKDATALRRVSFVMKDGKVWKNAFYPIGIVEELRRECEPLVCSWEVV